MIYKALLLIFFLISLSKSLSQGEKNFLIKYIGVDGFPLNSSTIDNACDPLYYMNIVCNSNGSITGFGGRFCGGNDIIPIEIENLTSLVKFAIHLKDYCSTPPSGTIPVIVNNGLLQNFIIDSLDISGVIPSQLFANPLQNLIITGSLLSGTVASELSLVTTLQMINLGNNIGLMGQFPSIDNLTSLTSLQLNNCNFSGKLPNISNSNIISTYDISNNKFNWGIPYFNSSMLVSIDMSNNQINDTLPINFIMDAYSFLFISLKSNFIFASLPSSIFHPSLIVLDVSSNMLSGNIDKAIVNCNNSIQQFIFSRNNFNGNLPSEMNGVVFKDLFKISFAHNNLSGSIPTFNMMTGLYPSFSAPSNTIFYGYIYILFNDNLFDNFVPSFQNFQVSTTIDLSENLLQLDNNSLGEGGNVTWLSLSNNNIIYLPDIFSNPNTFTSLITLDLSYNMIQGTIPQLFHVKNLQLNNNFFTGESGSLLINPNYTNFPVYVNLKMNRLDISSEKNSIFGTASKEEYGLNLFSSEVNLNDFPQQTRNCLDNTTCDQICIDLWDQMSSTDVNYRCDCYSGFALDINQKSCIPCSDNNWTYYPYPSSLKLFNNFRSLGYDLSLFSFSTCSDCSDGFLFRSRNVISSLSCSTILSSEYQSCSFACNNLTALDTSSGTIFTLSQELTKNNFLNNIMNVLLGINITITENKKRNGQNVLSFFPSNCNVNLTTFTNIISALTIDIVPNIPLLDIKILNCSTDVISTDPNPNFPIWAIILIAVLSSLSLLVVLIISLLGYQFYNNSIHYLPREINWSFKNQLISPWSWDKNISGKNYYYSKNYQVDSEEYNKVNNLLNTFFGNTNLEVTSITAIYNPNLTQNFINTHKVMTSRYRESFDLFYQCTYKKNENKLKILKYFNDNIINYFDYNSKLDVPIIPCLHATSKMVSGFIAMTNNATLNNLDPGFYGSKSIYFTTKLYYTLPYVGMYREGAVVISYVIPGNVFAVDESHTGPNSLMGKPIPSPYNSNFVLTNRKGLIYQNGDGEPNNEVIIPNDNQSVPAFIVTLDFNSVLREFKNWERELVDDKVISRENLDCVIDIDDRVKEI